MIGVLIAAWLDVRSKPIRTIAGVAGMIAAVVAVVMVDAASVLSHQANQEYIASTYGRTATISISADGTANPARDDPDSATGLVPWLASNGITRVSTDLDIGGILVRGTQVVSTRAQWVSSIYPAVSILDMHHDAFPGVTAQSPALHAVIGFGVARELGFDGTDATGQVLLFRPGSEGSSLDLRTARLRPIVIDAVADTLGVGGIDRNVLIVSDNYHADLANGRALRWLVHVDPKDVTLVLNLVDRYGSLSGSELSAHRVDRGEELAPLLDQQAVTARVVSLVALLVGGLGILGVGLAGVRERSQEFGLRRALGGNKRLVFLGVIIQTMIEVVIAAALAIPIAAILIRIYARDLVLETLPLPASTTLPVSSALLGVAGALAVGLLAGLLPAIRASRTSVVTALHGE